MNILQPTLLIDESRCKANIKMMADKCNALGLEFRPHFKTHQSHKIGQWFREKGVEAITVSSLGMAKYFADDGWDDITVAFPCNIKQIDEINELAKSINLVLLVDNSDAAKFLSVHLKYNVELFIEIDCGGGRSGIRSEKIEEVLQLAQLISEANRVHLKGIYSHAGHTYGAKGISEILEMSGKSIKSLNLIYDELTKQFGELEFCYGDTPSCSVRDEFGKATALSPGNFVFYDVMQAEIGSCDLEKLGVVMACPVVSIKKDRSEVLIYGGAVHLSKDRDSKHDFGIVVSLNHGWNIMKEAKVVRLSQEHGVISMPDEEIAKLSIGDALGVLPIHSCLTAECIGEYRTLSGEFVDHFKQKKHA